MTPAELWLIPLGVAVGTFGTLVGAGGGFVLVPVLLLLYPDRDPGTITAMSLFVVCANAASGSVAYARQHRIDYVSGGWFLVGTLPGATAGALVVNVVPARLFNGVFALALCLLGTLLVIKRHTPSIANPVIGRLAVRRDVRDREGNHFVYGYHLGKALAISVGIGFVSSLLGIGGGIVHVPVMATALHFPVHIAAATSHFVLAFTAGEGTLVHVASGTLRWDATLGQAALIGLGAVPGAQLGALLSRRLHGPVIIRALAVALLLVGVRLGVKAIWG